MDPMLIQNVLAARRNTDSDGWMQLLVFVIMAVLYGLASIAKAKSNKKAFEEDEELEEVLGEEPFEEPLATPQPREQVADRQPARPTPRPIARPVQPQVAEEEPVPIQEFKEAQKVTRETLTPLKQPLARSIESEELIDELGLELDNRENLRKAILYREILGKPTSLRDE